VAKTSSPEAKGPTFKVFISHDARDKELALRLFLILRRIGAEPYMYERHPDYSQDIPHRIMSVLTNVELVICLLTKNSINSQWVHQELGAAYALKKVIITCLEEGVGYVGFVELRPHIPYDPNPRKFDRFAKKVIYAVRNEFLGHKELGGFTLTCSREHTNDDYKLPSTSAINKMIRDKDVFTYKCKECNRRIRFSPYTLEELD